jgi:hypothetical protein
MNPNHPLIPGISCGSGFSREYAFAAKAAPTTECVPKGIGDE